MNKYYFTFAENSRNYGKYYVIQATNPDLARKEMDSIFGKTWTLLYNDAQWKLSGLNLIQLT